MKIIKPSFKILTATVPAAILHSLETAGRTCYKSEDKMTEESSKRFVANLLKHGHESVIEHQSVSVRIVCDRGVTHEIVRHRIASYSQESTRFCNYGKSDHVVFIKPPWVSDDWLGEFNFESAAEVADYQSGKQLMHCCWSKAMFDAEQAYFRLIRGGWQPQQARSVLPNSLKTEIVATMNLREWRHFFKLRAAGSAGRPHPQMLEITVPMLAEFKKLVPVVFDDIEPIVI